MRTVQHTNLDGNASDEVGDEFKYFTTAEPTFIPQDKIYEWWSDQDRLPHIRQMTYDLPLYPCYERGNRALLQWDQAHYYTHTDVFRCGYSRGRRVFAGVVQGGILR